MALDDKTFRFDRFTLDLRRGCLFGPSGEIELRPKSFELLCYLVRNAGRLALKDEIIQSVWPKVIATDASLAQCVSEVRLALCDQEQRILKTVPRRGYLFTAAVVQRSAEPDITERPDAPAACPEVKQRDVLPDSAARDDVEQVIARRQPVERRPMTVLACEWIGLAAQAARLDPEDMRACTEQFHAYCADIVAPYQGYLTRNLDKVLIYFGYPVAREHDAEHAVRAGLRLLGAVASLRGKDPAAQLRIGAASGIVVVGGDGDAEPLQNAGVGATPHLARMLMSVAEPGGLIIAENTRRLVGQLFSYREVAPINFDDRPVPVQAWHVTGARDEVSRLEALRPHEPTPLVGREEETGLLRRRWRQVASGDGQIVLVGGEPGVGKSRLAAALRNDVAAEPHTYLQFGCSPHHRDSPLHPVIRWLEHAAGIAPGDPPEARRDRLHALLARTQTSSEDEAVFAELLSAPQDGSSLELDITPPERRRRTLAAVTNWIVALARRQPLLAVFEDVHWIDPTSLDVLNHLVERVAALRVLMIVTYRPEFEPPGLGAPHVTLMVLNRLTPRAARELISRIGAADQLLPPHLIEDIVRRGDGVPLFLEELTHAAADRSQEMPDTTGHDTTSAVPPILRAALTARLDRLGAAREIAQIGAVIGREFSYALLSSVSGCSEAELAGALDRLVQNGVIRPDGSVPHATFLFKHALIRDVAYGMLTRQARQGLHARIATALKQNFPERCDSQPELLADHYIEAGEIAAAIIHWGKAGELALRRAAFAEAVAHLGRAVESADRAAPALPSGVRLELQRAYGQALLWASGYSAPETIAAFRRAKQLAAGIENISERGAANYSLCAASVLRGEVGSTRELAEELWNSYRSRPPSAEATLASSMLGLACLLLAEFDQARAQFEKALAIHDASRDRVRGLQIALEPGAAALIDLALVRWALGDTGPARQAADEAMAIATATGHVPTLVYVHSHKVTFELMRRNAALARPHSDTVIQLSREHGLALYLTYAEVCEGWIRSQLGHEPQSAAMERALQRMQENGVRLALPWCLTLLAEVQMKDGETGAALTSIDQALAEADRTGERWCMAESRRLRGKILLSRDPANAAAAEKEFRAAIDIAQEQNARSYALRAALSLAKLHHAQGQDDEVRRVLAPLIDGLATTSELPEIEQAQWLLRQFDEPEQIERPQQAVH